MHLPISKLESKTMERRQTAMAFTAVVSRLGRQVTSKLPCVPPGVVWIISSLRLEDRILRAPNSIGTPEAPEYSLWSRMAAPESQICVVVRKKPPYFTYLRLFFTKCAYADRLSSCRTSMCNSCVGQKKVVGLRRKAAASSKKSLG